MTQQQSDFRMKEENVCRDQSRAEQERMDGWRGKKSGLLAVNMVEENR